MKKQLLILLFCILGFNIQFYAQTWERLSYLPTSQQVERLYFYDSNLGFGGGSGGAAIRTTDGGASWEQVMVSPTNSDGLKDFSFVSPTVGYACGYQFSIYKTTDGGLTWTQLARNVQYKGYWAIAFTDALTGYVAGDDGIIKKTTDGGATWVPQVSGVTYTINKLIAVNSSIIVAAGNGTSDNKRILKTTNGGTTWVENTSGAASMLNYMQTPDKVNFFAGSANGKVYKSADVCETWSEILTPTTNAIWGVFFSSNLIGYIADQYGHIYKTINGGTNWTALTNGVPSGIYLYGIWFPNANNGFTIGYQGTMLKTTDAGASWSVMNKGVYGELGAAWFTDLNTGYVGDYSSPNVYKSSNGGQDWAKLSPGNTGAVIDMFFSDQNTGYFITSYPNEFYKTANAGTGWTSVSLESSLGTAPVAFHFPTSLVGYIVGSKKIIKTIDGGSTWTLVKSDFPQNLNGCYFNDALHGYVCGDVSYIAYTSDGGTTWIPQPASTEKTLYSIDFRSSTAGVAVGASGTILKTANGGTDWTDRSITGMSSDFFRVRMFNTQSMIACGTGGKVYRSVDSGNNWTDFSVPSNTNLYTLCVSGETVWLVGSEGNIFKSVIPLPVELASFNASAAGGKVSLNWSTATEVNNYGFKVERKIEGVSEAGSLRNWEEIGFVKGNGSSNSPKVYSFIDASPLAGKVMYRLKQIDNDGNFKYYDAITVSVNEPKEYKLMQNSPNPFNPSTAIKFQLPKNEFVTVKIYDQIGREVTTLINEEKPSGSHIVYWNGRDSKGQAVSSGVYLYKLTAGSYIQTRKMNLLK